MIRTGSVRVGRACIIIPIHNGARFLPDLLDRLKKEIRATRSWSVSLVGVDNASSDDSHDIFQAFSSSHISCFWIHHEKNLGFAAACNAGISYAQTIRADAVVLLNQDALPSEGCLCTLLSDSSDVASPVLSFLRDGRMMYDYGGIVRWWKGQAVHREYSALLSLSSAMRYAGDIDYVSGCCMRIFCRVFDRIGMFDTRFFLYFEDVDFCLRSRRAGFSVRCLPSAVSFHHLREGYARSIQQSLHLIASSVLFIRKWNSWRSVCTAYFFLALRSVPLLFFSLIHTVGKKD